MPVSPVGKFYEFNDMKIKLYPIACVSSALADVGYYRDTQTIRKWETFNVTPPAIFRSGQKRLYHQKQIKVFAETAKECNIQQGYSLAMTDFSQKMWERLTEVNKELMEGKVDEED